MEYFSLCVKVIEDEKEKYGLDHEEISKRIAEYDGADELLLLDSYERCAFMFKSGTCTLSFIKDCMQKFLTEYVEIKDLLISWKEKTDLKFCSISKGPALDYIALTLALSECVEFDLQPSFSCVNIIAKSAQWRFTVNLLMKNIKNINFLNIPVSKFSDNYEVVLDEYVSFPEKHNCIIQETDVVFMVKAMNSSGYESPKLKKIYFQELVAAMKSGSCLFFLDTKPSCKIMIEVLNEVSGKFLYGPFYYTYQLPEKFPDSYKSIYGVLPSLSSKGEFFVWKKLSSDSDILTKNPVLFNVLSSVMSESDDVTDNSPSIETNKLTSNISSEDNHSDFLNYIEKNYYIDPKTKCNEVSQRNSSGPLIPSICKLSTSNIDRGFQSPKSCDNTKHITKKLFELSMYTTKTEMLEEKTSLVENFNQNSLHESNDDILTSNSLSNCSATNENINSESLEKSGSKSCDTTTSLYPKVIFCSSSKSNDCDAREFSAQIMRNTNDSNMSQNTGSIENSSSASSVSSCDFFSPTPSMTSYFKSKKRRHRSKKKILPNTAPTPDLSGKSDQIFQFHNENSDSFGAKYFVNTSSQFINSQEEQCKLQSMKKSDKLLNSYSSPSLSHSNSTEVKSKINANTFISADFNDKSAQLLQFSNQNSDSFVTNKSNISSNQFLNSQENLYKLHSKKKTSDKKLKSSSSLCSNQSKSSERKNISSHIPETSIKTDSILDFDSKKYSVQALTERIKKLVTTCDKILNHHENNTHLIHHESSNSENMHPSDIMVNGCIDDQSAPQNCFFNYSACHLSNKAHCKTDSLDEKSKVLSHDSQVTECYHQRRKCLQKCHCCMCVCQKMQMCSHNCRHFYGVSHGCNCKNYSSCHSCSGHCTPLQNNSVPSNIVIPLQDISSDALTKIIALLKSAEKTSSAK